MCIRECVGEGVAFVAVAGESCVVGGAASATGLDGVAPANLGGVVVATDESSTPAVRPTSAVQ